MFFRSYKAQFWQVEVHRYELQTNDYDLTYLVCAVDYEDFPRYATRQVNVIFSEIPLRLLLPSPFARQKQLKSIGSAWGGWGVPLHADFNVLVWSDTIASEVSRIPYACLTAYTHARVYIFKSSCT